MNINPYLTFDGNAAEAMGFYHTALGGTLSMQTFADFGAPVSDDYKDKIMHAHLETPGGGVLMGSDAMEGRSPRAGDNISVSVSGGVEDTGRLTAAFAALSDGGTVTMPLGDSPWNALFGMFRDRYGVDWLINIDKG